MILQKNSIAELNKRSPQRDLTGAKIVLANLVDPRDPWQGILIDRNVASMAREFLSTIE